MMRSILLHQNQDYDHLSWDVICNGFCAERLAWDEMLWVLAITLLRTDGQRPFPTGWFEARPINRNEWYDIQEVEPGWWTVFYQGTFRDRLGASEMLGLIASITAPGHPLFGGLKTYEQVVSDYFFRKYQQQPIAGLLTYQPLQSA